MYSSVDQWRADADNAMWRLESKLCEARQIQAEIAKLSAEAIEACKWPSELPIPTDPDEYGATQIDGVNFGQDVSLEWACAQGCTEFSARAQITDIMMLTNHLPGCWERIILGKAPLWQGQKVAAACYGINPEDYWYVDYRVHSALGAFAPGRVQQFIDEAVKYLEPKRSRLAAKTADRFVRTGGDKQDPLTGWVIARLDRADAIFLDAIIQRIADELAAKGDTSSQDRLRAKAMGMFSNPASVVDLIGLPTLRSMLNPPETEEQKQAMVDACAKLTGVFTRNTQVYVHLHAETLWEADELARVETIGPVLVDQVKMLTGGTIVKLTPVIHIGGAGEAVDMYETPIRIRNKVILRNHYDVSPWSSISSRNCDIDHTIAYEPGVAGQTREDNLGPVSRRFHRAKTVAGWQLEQPKSGVFLWETPSGQRFQVDKDGTQRLPRRE